MRAVWIRITYAFVAVALIATYAMFRQVQRDAGSAHLHTQTDPVTATVAGDWFQQMRAHCNGVEVETWMRRLPPPDTQKGQSQAAACWALAGEIDRARAVIQALPQDQQWQAANVVFGIGHPVADSGNEVAAGPLMELVVEFWPNNYMALYHAGASRFQNGDADGAAPYLRDFLRYYERDDGWTRSARSMLGEG